ncbi:MerR family transcriptional regulator [Rathayibacter sp. KR2-224]|uniref:MerR family transcriptional regulator n=1 Tax=Rathayibacter sp. KR2-224 TaxID=3400913 RepID=UPI003C0C4066
MTAAAFLGSARVRTSVAEAALEGHARSSGMSAGPGRIDDVTGSLVSIGDFSRMTHLTVKALRYYHDVGVLEPASVDPSSGYRRYATDQVPVAQVVKRLRALDMPIDEVREVVSSPDVESRNRTIAAHLKRMEAQLAKTNDAVASLRALLGSEGHRDGAVSFRTRAAQTVLAIDEQVDMERVGPWLLAALGELVEAAGRLHVELHGAPGTLFYPELFEEGRGRLTAFVPVREGRGEGIRSGRVEWVELPAGDSAVMLHVGSHADMDTTYGELGSYVAQRAIGVTGPIREDFLVSALDTDREADYRTEVSWPVFRTADESS